MKAERKCRNPNCDKPIPSKNKAYCSLACKGMVRRHPLAEKIWDMRRDNPKVNAKTIAETLGISTSAVMGLLYSRTDRPPDVPIDSPQARAARLQYEQEKKEREAALIAAANKAARDSAVGKSYATDNTCIAPGCGRPRDIVSGRWYCKAHSKALKGH